MNSAISNTAQPPCSQPPDQILPLPCFSSAANNKSGLPLWTRGEQKCTSHFSLTLWFDLFQLNYFHTNSIVVDLLSPQTESGEAPAAALLLPTEKQETRVHSEEKFVFHFYFYVWFSTIYLHPVCTMVNISALRFNFETLLNTSHW